jgi:hypothetical protein
VVLTLAGVGGGVGPNQLLGKMSLYSLAIWVLLPFAVVDVLTTGSWRGIDPYHLALGWSVVLLMVTYTDVGAGFNQLLDVTVLAVIAADHLAGRLQTSKPPLPRSLWYWRSRWCGEPGPAPCSLRCRTSGQLSSVLPSGTPSIRSRP